MRPDLRVLLIHRLPDADGLKELSSHIKVLTKPFRRATLIAQLKTLVRESLLVVPDEVMVLAENR